MSLAKADAMATIPVEDVDEARRFYGGRLNLEEVGQVEENQVLYRCGGTYLCLHVRETVQPSEATVCAFEVADVEATVKDLRRNGIDFDEYDIPGWKNENGVARKDEFRMAWFQDPWGNILAVDNSIMVASRKGIVEPRTT